MVIQENAFVVNKSVSSEYVKRGEGTGYRDVRVTEMKSFYTT